MYKIEKNIPIPIKVKGQYSNAFDEVLYNMRVGDSIEVKSVKESRAFYQRMYYLKKYKKLSKDYKIDIRTISPDVSYRIWRTK
jgi:hypothetical protein|tara:strand:- start:51 stop:299 length:249 start_codon:yes stop_codon:yes gene_type:complete